MSTTEYQRYHARVYKKFGRAKEYHCSDCNKPANVWAWTHDTDPSDPNNYYPLCYSCHIKYDMKPQWRANQSSAWNYASIQSKLTEQDVIDIRRDYMNNKWSMRDLAEIHGVTITTISNIINKRTWAHIADNFTQDNLT